MAVIFGGPSPEHDVSILTGLQAARALVTAGRAGVEAVYWTKGERFVAVEPTLEASAFLEGAPKGARELRFVAQPGGGFFTTKPGVLGAKERRMDFDVLVNCCHGGPGEDGTLQAALDLAGVAYTGPAAAAATLCMDKLAFGAVVQARRAAGAAPQARGPGAAKRLIGTAWAAPISSSPVSAVPPSASKSSRTGPTSSATPSWAVPTPSGGWWPSPSAADAYDVNVSVRAYPALALSLFDRPLRPAGAGPILSYSDKYLGGEGMVSAPRELPGQARPRAGEGVAGRGHDGGRPGRRARGLAHRFPGRGRRAVVGKRGQHHPRLSGQVPLVRRRGRRFPHLVGRHDRGGEASAQCPVGVDGRRRVRSALGGLDSQQARIVTAAARKEMA